MAIAWGAVHPNSLLRVGLKSVLDERPENDGAKLCLVVVVLQFELVRGPVDDLVAPGVGPLAGFVIPCLRRRAPRALTPVFSHAHCTSYGALGAVVAESHLHKVRRGGYG